jgi:hypothetical protein
MTTVCIKIKSFEDMAKHATSVNPYSVNLDAKTINLNPFIGPAMLSYCNTLQKAKQVVSYYRVQGLFFGDWMIDKVYTYEEALKHCPELLI